MMFENSSKGYKAKQEDEDDDDDDNEGMKIEKFSKAASSTSSRQWTALRNPRIVRVSRSLGGKDRHSKVCTIRGLRDRRIRLSVPTAIQLYDLQDRLGLSQPSKVVDWLLEVTKSDIDKLPPLDFPQLFSQFHHHQQTLFPMLHQPAAGTGSTSFSLGGFYDNNNNNNNTNSKDGGNHPNHMMAAKSRYNWDMDSSVARLKGKEADDEQENYHKLNFHIGMTNCSNAMTYMEPSNLSLSQFGSHNHIGNNNLFPCQQQQVDSTSSGMQFSSSNLSHHVVPPSGYSQLLFCPSSATPSYAPPFMSMESEYPRQSNNNHFQFLSSSSSSSQETNMHPRAFIPPPLGVRHHPITPFSSKLLDSDNNNNHSARS